MHHKKWMFTLWSATLSCVPLYLLQMWKAFHFIETSVKLSTIAIPTPSLISVLFWKKIVYFDYTYCPPDLMIIQSDCKRPVSALLLHYWMAPMSSLSHRRHISSFITKCLGEVRLMEVGWDNIYDHFIMFFALKAGWLAPFFTLLYRPAGEQTLGSGFHNYVKKSVDISLTKRFLYLKKWGVHCKFHLAWIFLKKWWKIY